MAKQKAIKVEKEAVNVETKPDIQALAVESKVAPLVGKKVSSNTGTGGKVRLRHSETNVIITGFIPLHLAQMQIKQNNKIEIVNE